MAEEYEEDVTFCIAIEGTDINLNYLSLVERLMEEIRKIIQPISEAFKSFIRCIANTFRPIAESLVEFAKKYDDTIKEINKQSYPVTRSTIPSNLSTKPIIHKRRSMIRRTC